MSYISEQLDKTQTTWKKLATFVAWIATMASTFILPLPSWGATEENSSLTHFIIFVSTVLAGFMLILTYKNRRKSFWLWTSIIIFMLFVSSYIYYTMNRKINTLNYSGTDIIIGSVLAEGSQAKLDYFKLRKNDSKLLYMVGGDPHQIWTHESIEKNRWELIVFLSVCYCLLAIFIISFVNAILLNTTSNA